MLVDRGGMEGGHIKTSVPHKSGKEARVQGLCNEHLKSIRGGPEATTRRPDRLGCFGNLKTDGRNPRIITSEGKGSSPCGKKIAEKVEN